MLRLQRLSSTGASRAATAAVARHAAPPTLAAWRPDAGFRLAQPMMAQHTRNAWTSVFRPSAPRDPRRPPQPWDPEVGSASPLPRPLVADPHPSGWGSAQPERGCPECWAAAAALVVVLAAGMYAVSSDETKHELQHVLSHPRELLELKWIRSDPSQKHLDQVWEQHQAQVHQRQVAGTLPVSTQTDSAATPSTSRQSVVAVPLTGLEPGLCVDVAPLPRRLLAYLIDVLLVQGVTGLAIALASVVAPPHLQAQLRRDQVLTSRALQLGVFALLALYDMVLSVYWDGQTVGKRMLGLRLRRRDFEQMGWTTSALNAAWKHLALMAGAADVLPLCIESNRSEGVLLHNYMSKTIVVHEHPRSAPASFPPTTAELAAGCRV